jgi:hypothetical protein
MGVDGGIIRARFIPIQVEAVNAPNSSQFFINHPKTKIVGRIDASNIFRQGKFCLLKKNKAKHIIAITQAT